MAPERSAQVKTDALWFKDAVIYQLHVRAFQDSNGDGIGDFPGLIDRLDYLSDLGVTAIWLLPFYPSPLKDDGYDIADYTQINSSYGTLKDFQRFLREAHARGMKVITELVINHTSDQHEWFQKSRRAAPGSYWRDFYVWSENPAKYKGVRIIFKDFETSNWSWDPVAKAYYWHRFYSHQPDLNFDNPEVQKAVFQALDFWMEMGVDGLRLDAVPYLFEREGTSCENLPETHEFLQKLRSYVDKKYTNRMLLAEANQWPEDAVTYFGKGDECHMNFHFPLMPRLFMALKMEDRYSIIDILKQTPEIPENCQWATFLRNHDELTLEMVTDEERDYMYKVYASDPRARINLGVRRRLAPLVGNDRRQIELLNGLLFSLPGSPIIYYGDELGMGDNIYLGDRDGVRTPMQWSADRNAGFSRANPQQLYLPVIQSPEYHAEAINVETAHANTNSLLWWMRKMITLRRAYPELSRGKLEFLENNNQKVLSFVRRHGDKTILCLFNLSRTAQFVELDLARFKGQVPMELFGQTDFPAIGDLPYFLTLSAYGFYWFELVEKQSLETGQWLLRQPAAIEVSNEPLRALKNKHAWNGFERGLMTFLPRMRWFAGKGRKITNIDLDTVFFLQQYGRTDQSALAILRVSYMEGIPDQYQLGISYAEGERADRIRGERPDLVIAEAHASGGGTGIFYDAILDGGFSQSLLEFILKNESLEQGSEALLPDITNASFAEWTRDIPEPSLSGLEQSNSSVLFGKHFYMKLYRRIEEGENPEIEIGRYLTRKDSKVGPQMVGSLNLRQGKRSYSLAIVQQVVESQNNGWNLFVDQLGRVAEQVLAEDRGILDLGLPPGTLADLRKSQPPAGFNDIAGYTFALARQLGEKTAEMHLVLGDEDRELMFIPEAFTPFHQRSSFQSFRNLADKVLNLLRKHKDSLPEDAGKLADAVLMAEKELYRRFDFMRSEVLDANRSRIHGDYHLGQVLFTGTDFSIVDFEGEPARGLGERRLKRSPLKDVAGMLRSFDYAAAYYMKVRVLRPDDRTRLAPVLKAWAAWAGLEFVNAYLTKMGDSHLVPRDLRQAELALQTYVLEKALYEVGYELRTRPEWIDIPLGGILDLLQRGQ